MATYTADHESSSLLHALVLRSPHAHAKFKLDATKARTLPGVAAILSAADTADLGGLPCLFNLPDQPFTAPAYPILARDEGPPREGDAIAFVVAETLDQARDAIEAISVAWQPLCRRWSAWYRP